MSKWTEEQLLAINSEGKNIIVSAGAGSGKTAVLSERVLRKINDNVPINRLLILTFTNEAAKEMKDRIRKKLINEKKMEQLSLLEESYITTFDSYSLSIVKKYHYLLNVSKDIKIIDDTIISNIKDKFIDEIFEELYEEKDDNFLKLIRNFCLKDYKNIKEVEYVQYLWKAFENNYQNEQYQFAFMGYHMLFMCFVYFTIWKIKSIHPEDFKKISYGFEDCLNKATSPFGFSEEQESRILRIFKFWGLNERIGEYKKLVKERNNIAHSNGNIYYKEQASVDVRISDVLRFAEEIHQKTKASIEQAYKVFLIENYSMLSAEV